LGLASTSDPAYEALLATAKEKNVYIKLVSAGYILEKSDRLNMRILFPVDPAAFLYSNASGPDIVITLQYGSSSVLFMGDATTKIQKAISSDKIDVLVTSNAASAFNLAPSFVNRIHPSYLIYSKSITTKTASKKDKEDPLFFVTFENRFNLKEKGTIRIVSNGSRLEIK
jgi:beta-lactamase superfamily II metal-dependent hydrolase